MKLVLDRIEKNSKGIKIAVFEFGDKFIDVDENSMPKGFMDELKAGDFVEAEYLDGVIVKAEILKNETEEKRNEMKSRLAKLKNRNKK